MALTKKRIDDALGYLVIRKNGRYYIHESDVDTAIQCIIGTFVGCYANVETVGAGKRIVIGNALTRVSKPLIEIFIRNDI